MTPRRHCRTIVIAAAVVAALGWTSATADDKTALPCLAATLSFERSWTDGDGVRHVERWRERFARCDDRVWRDRIRPTATHQHEKSPARLARLVTRAALEGASLTLVDREARELFVVDPPEHELVGFDGRFAPAATVVDVRDAGWRPLRRGPRDARWLARRTPSATTEVLWSDRLAFPLGITSDVRAGRTRTRTRMDVTLEPRPARWPWETLAGYRQRRWSDLLD